jgi:hypothetical protein
VRATAAARPAPARPLGQSRARVEVDVPYDGKYVLRTTTDLPADELALAY